MYENENDYENAAEAENDPAVVADAPTGRSRRTKIVIGAAGAVGGILLLATLTSLDSGNRSTASPPTATPSATATPTVAPTPTYTPEPSIPPAGAVWTAFSAEDQAEICAATGAGRRGTFNMTAYTTVTNITDYNTYTTAEVEAAVDCPKPKPVVYRTVNERTLAKVIRDPDGHIGEGYVVYGEISQFDSATGLDTFRAQVAHSNVEYFYSDGENSMFEGKENALEDLIDGDVFKAKVIVKGSLSYDTQNGGNTTVPVFTVTWIDQIGHND